MQRSEIPARGAWAAVVSRGDLAVTVEASGVIEPVATVEVKSKASGEFLELGAETGDGVKGGQVLVRLDPRTPQNRVDQAQAEVNASSQRLATAETQLAAGAPARIQVAACLDPIEALRHE